MLRRAKIADANAIRLLRVESIKGLASAHYPQAEIESWCGTRSPEAYHSPIELKVVLVDEQEGQIVAFGQLDLATAFIEAIYVHPLQSRQGLGLKMLRALEAIAASNEIRELVLEASLNAVEFYQHAGYVSATRGAHEQSHSVVKSCVFMRHQLAGPTAA